MGTAANGRKAFALKAVDALASRRDYAAAQQFWSADCSQHSTIMDIAPARWAGRRTPDMMQDEATAVGVRERAARDRRQLPYTSLI
jgi:hypothetical protein